MHAFAQEPSIIGPFCGENRKYFMSLEHLRRHGFHVCICERALYDRACRRREAYMMHVTLASATFFMYTFAKEPSLLGPFCRENRKYSMPCEYVRRFHACICARALYDSSFLLRESYMICVVYTFAMCACASEQFVRLPVRISRVR